MRWFWLQGNGVLCSADVQADTSEVFPQDGCLNSATVHMLLLNRLRGAS